MEQSTINTFNSNAEVSNVIWINFIAGTPAGIAVLGHIVSTNKISYHWLVNHSLLVFVMSMDANIILYSLLYNKRQCLFYFMNITFTILLMHLMSCLHHTDGLI